MFRKLLLAGVMLSGLASTANAVTLSTPVGPLPTNSSFNTTFNSAGGSSSISFDLLGYISLDGVNCCTDAFSLSLNSVQILEGSYHLGGGGSNVTNVNTFGLSFAGLNPNPAYLGPTNAFITISGTVNLLAGSNTLTFAYTSLSFQGIGDEGWGVDNLDVSNVSTVPLPAALPLLAAGLALLGGIGVRRRGVAAS